MVEPQDRDRLRDLEERIEAAKGKPEPKHHSEEHYSQAQLAWRMVIELVAGLGLGFAIGYGLDTLFGTRPILMVVFLFFGLAAGINVMLRTAKEVTLKGQGPTEKDERDGDG